MWSQNQKTREQKKKGRKKTYKCKQNYKENGNRNKHINNYNIINYINNYLNKAALNLQPKDIDWVYGYKNKIHIYDLYKRSVLFFKRFIILHWGIPDY